MESTPNSRAPEFWDTRIRAGRMPWDKGGVPADLSHYLAGVHSSGGCVLIPGCGTAYEVRAFRDAGYEVIGIDFCEAAVEMGRRALGPVSQAIVLGDFFTYDFKGQRFDLIYERAFVCSMSPALWPLYAQRIKDLLLTGGLLLGSFYYGPKDDDGPPFGLEPDEMGSLLGDAFTCLEDREVQDSMSLYAGGERWQVWRCTGTMEVVGRP